MVSTVRSRGSKEGREGIHTKHVEDEADEAMVRSKRQENLVHDENMLKVVDDALAVEKVHCGDEPVPVEALGGAEGAGARGDVCDGDDLLEGDDLDGGDDDEDVDVAHEEGGEEDADHDEGPYGACPEVCFLLFVRGLFLLLGRGFLLRRRVGLASCSFSKSPGWSIVREGLCVW